ncbi:MAG: hypothetical protein HZY76_03825 [Anaerolineae bacterium]|nr:MAG: hypothetical protein HZY76_03825 [Anaerolineae bacterium]
MARPESSWPTVRFNHPRGLSRLCPRRLGDTVCRPAGPHPARVEDDRRPDRLCRRWADWGVAGDGLILKTTDGGATWVEQAHPVTGWLHGLNCFDANRCWTAGKFGYILRTTNGGASWVRSSARLRRLALLGRHRRREHHPVGRHAGEIFRSTNAGVNWTLNDVDGNPNGGVVMWDFACFDGVTCYTASNGSKVYKSSNGGRTWRVTFNYPAPDNLAIDCIDPNECWIGGGSQYHGTVYYAADAGVAGNSTWVEQTRKANKTFYGITVLPSRVGWAMGARVSAVIRRWARPRTPPTASIGTAHPCPPAPKRCGQCRCSTSTMAGP